MRWARLCLLLALCALTSAPGGLSNGALSAGSLGSGAAIGSGSLSSTLSSGCAFSYVDVASLSVGGTLELYLTAADPDGTGAADCTTYADEAKLATWTATGNISTKTFTQGTDSLRPTVETSEIGDSPVIRSDGADDFLRHSGAATQFDWMVNGDGASCYWIGSVQVSNSEDQQYIGHLNNTLGGTADWWRMMQRDDGASEEKWAADQTNGIGCNVTGANNSLDPSEVQIFFFGVDDGLASGSPDCAGQVEGTAVSAERASDVGAVSLAQSLTLFARGTDDGKNGQLDTYAIACWSGDFHDATERTTVENAFEAVLGTFPIAD